MQYPGSSEQANDLPRLQALWLSILHTPIQEN
jgi:hypothetical protein